MPFSFNPTQNKTEGDAKPDAESVKETTPVSDVATTPTPTQPTSDTTITSSPTLNQGAEQQTPVLSNIGIPLSNNTNTNESYLAGVRFPVEKVGIAGIIIIGLFIMSIITTAVLFGYHYYLIKKVESSQTKLNEYEKKMGEIPLEDMGRLSNRLKIVGKLIKEHPSVNAAFRIIEETVENNITYKKFDLHPATGSNSYELRLSAVAPNYKSVVEQIDTLKRKPYSNYVISPTLTSINLDDQGGVSFSISMLVPIVGVLPEDLTFNEAVSEVEQFLLDVSTSTILNNSTTTMLQASSSKNLIPSTSTQPILSTSSKVVLPPEHLIIKPPVNVPKKP